MSSILQVQAYNRLIAHTKVNKPIDMILSGKFLKSFAKGGCVLPQAGKQMHDRA